MPDDRMPRCRGLLGLIFGHKFFFGNVFVTDDLIRVDTCQRCGFNPKRQS